MSNLLILLHTRSNTGYAIDPLERIFYRVGLTLVGEPEHLHFGYRSLDRGRPSTLPPNFSNIVALDPRIPAREHRDRISSYIRANGIETVFAFDAPVSLPGYAVMRRAGVRRIISYQGAPMSSLFSGVRLALKRAEVRARRNRPEHYIFESEAMRETAVNGRGIPRDETSVVHLGADGTRYAPCGGDYAHRTFGIPRDRKIVVFSGHMEPRKGVRVLVSAFVELARRGRDDLHLLVLGNQGTEADRFASLYRDTPAADLVTFGGYRDDIPEIFASADIGAIASTGWDSFTMSSVEMALSALPLIVSNLQGLAETVEPGVTGFTFTPGSAGELADHIVRLADDEPLLRSMGAAGRDRALRMHSVERQVEELAATVRRVEGRRTGGGLW